VEGGCGCFINNSQQPQGGPQNVNKLKISLYGLQQRPEKSQWQKKNGGRAELMFEKVQQHF